MDYQWKMKSGVIAMKYVKSISLFLIYPLLALGIGFYAGVKSSPFFYLDRLPQESPAPAEDSVEEPDVGDQGIQAAGPEPVLESGTQQAEAVPEPTDPSAEAEEVLFTPETLCVDTEYVLEETDILHHTVVETTQRLPDKYVGMNREEFLQAMDLYEAFPPLSEMERGFVNLEVLSFSRERVVVQMNYKYVQPSESFYLAVYDNEVIVYLEDRKTVYIETEIELDSLPEQIQHNIIQMMWIENEEKLYDFLENYSS